MRRCVQDRYATRLRGPVQFWHFAQHREPSTRTQGTANGLAHFPDRMRCNRGELLGPKMADNQHCQHTMLWDLIEDPPLHTLVEAHTMYKRISCKVRSLAQMLANASPYCTFLYDTISNTLPCPFS